MLHVCFGLGTYADDRNTTRKFSESFLELFLVVFAVRLLDLSTDLSDALVNRFAIATALNEGCVVLVDDNFLDATKMLQRNFFELDAEVFADKRSAREDANVAEHSLASIAEAWRLDGADVERATQLVHYQESQRFRVNIFADDQEWLGSGTDLFEQWHQIANVADLLVVQENQSVLVRAAHRCRSIDEVRGNESLVELHTVDVFDSRIGSLALFNGDNAVFANTLERFGQKGSDGHVVVGRNRSDRSNFLTIADRLGHLLQLRNDGFDCFVDAASNGGWVAACGNIAEPFLEDRSSEDRSGGGPVASQVARLLRHFDDELSAHVFETVFEFDFLCDSNAVLRYGWSTETLVDDYVAAGRTHGHGYRIR